MGKISEKNGLMVTSPPITEDIIAVGREIEDRIPPGYGVVGFFKDRKK
jgi:hypothetical protein